MAKRDISLELLETMAGMQGLHMEEREDGTLVLLNETETFGGYYLRNTAGDIEEAINFYTYCAMHPVE